MVAKRAVRDFDMVGDTWATVEGWASRHGYRMASQAEGRRQYRKGHGLLVASRVVEVSTSGGQIHLEAWVATNILARAAALFIVPAEMTVESGGARGILPRKLGRTEVNDLIQAFGQQPIG
jgi:hypothetical protein